MASLRELKKRLKSVEQTGQLAGAMRTVSAAKYNRISRTLAGWRDYADACQSTLARFSAALAAALPCGDDTAPPCLVVIAANRGLCGGYNLELLAHAERVLAQYGAGAALITCNRRAETYFTERGVTPRQSFILPDTPDYTDCRAVCEWLRGAYAGGAVSSVTLVYQRFENMLTQTPVTLRLLGADAPARGEGAGVLCLPDVPTVLGRVAVSCVDAVICSAVLEAAAGAQAATLMAMRSACDNARESSAALSHAISQRRQSAITSGVIETSSDFGWEEN